MSSRREREFREFFVAAQPDVSGYCLALTGDPAVADEIAQEALTATYVRWSRLRTPRGYAFRVARNLASDHFRRRDRELVAWSEVAADVLPAPDSDAAVWDAVRRLPPLLRETVALHYLYDLPVADVAAVLRKPVGTVKRRLHDARAVLATTLEDVR